MIVSRFNGSEVWVNDVLALPDEVGYQSHRVRISGEDYTIHIGLCGFVGTHFAGGRLYEAIEFGLEAFGAITGDRFIDKQHAYFIAHKIPVERIRIRELERVWTHPHGASDDRSFYRRQDVAELLLADVTRCSICGKLNRRRFGKDRRRFCRDRRRKDLWQREVMYPLSISGGGLVCSPDCNDRYTNQLVEESKWISKSRKLLKQFRTEIKSRRKGRPSPSPSKGSSQARTSPH